jgi:ferredoxin--NADP+ reductase
VRGGVAPDHQKIKSVTRVYEKIASQPGVRFLGNVLIGRDLTREELLDHYHAVIYAFGAQSDRTLGIPGEHLAGSHAATEFVGWYNGHPDYRDHSFDLSQENVVVIGVGNVAVDVTRVLSRTPEELAKTDIAPYALEALRNSGVKNVYMIGRRGPVQAAFTNPELKELGEMPGADIVVLPNELALDEESRLPWPGPKSALRRRTCIRWRPSPRNRRKGSRCGSTCGSCCLRWNCTATAEWKR